MKDGQIDKNEIDSLICKKCGGKLKGVEYARWEEANTEYVVTLCTKCDDVKHWRRLFA